MNKISDTLDGYVSDETRQHREWLAARNRRVIEAVDCPRCESVATTPCTGTDDDDRHAGEELQYSHVQRLVAAGLGGHPLLSAGAFRR